jgi:hypothetical protein
MMCVWLACTHRILGRVVKALDLSPSGHSPRGFEPRSMHLLFCPLPLVLFCSFSSTGSGTSAQTTRRPPRALEVPRHAWLQQLLGWCACMLGSRLARRRRVHVHAKSQVQQTRMNNRPGTTAKKHKESTKHRAKNIEHRASKQKAKSKKQKAKRHSLLAGLNRRPFAYKANALPLS